MVMHAYLAETIIIMAVSFKRSHDYISSRPLECAFFISVYGVVAKGQG